MPDGTILRLEFKSGGAVTLSDVEAGSTHSHDGKWVINGDSIMVEGGEGMGMQLYWMDDALVTDFVGTKLTFTKK